MKFDQLTDREAQTLILALRNYEQCRPYGGHLYELMDRDRQRYCGQEVITDVGELNEFIEEVKLEL